ncbi:hypothetical protein H922_22232 [Citrobacter freundii GTC 09629]|uniref:Uncharacterized protein n=1 Tax=Salmonella enterica subsp. enterica serovar Cubana str. 76814 TaxID=1192560 RepID=V7IIW9_SALET|nr:hypothetical protein H922_22232 [Citrobacter freundii GTC 09629]ETA85878.1 hypothetical protein A628_04140 [Salmonella enterica subsp. enterica serovar Cubana str. 76814]KVJ40747.1 hypothetical protein AWS34_15170 [Enterobacter hormaechei subsp. steigerwaltii]OJX60638.1 MAG: hypothetical protein BGO85_01750 [Enterobacter sp. 56-7]BCP70799.1 hypothetical protein R1N_29860 [Enterobacter asburiae]
MVSQLLNDGGGIHWLGFAGYRWEVALMPCAARERAQHQKDDAEFHGSPLSYGCRNAAPVAQATA